MGLHLFDGLPIRVTSVERTQKERWERKRPDDLYEQESLDVVAKGLIPATCDITKHFQDRGYGIAHIEALMDIHDGAMTAFTLRKIARPSPARHDTPRTGGAR